MRTRAPALLLVALALAACAGPADSAAPPAVPTATTPVDTDCGSFTLALGERVPASAYTCVVDAVGARRSARLVEVGLTTEGDPVPVTYRAPGDGSVEIVTDTRDDAFSDRTVLRQTCTGPSVSQDGVLTFASCRDLPAGG